MTAEQGLSRDDVGDILEHAAMLPGGYTVQLVDVDGMVAAAVTSADPLRATRFTLFKHNQRAVFWANWQDETLGPIFFPDVEAAAAWMPDFMVPGAEDQASPETPSA